MAAKKSTTGNKGQSRAKKGSDTGSDKAVPSLKTPLTASTTAVSANSSSDGGSAEDRLGRRVPIQLLVDYKADGNYLFDFCRDLGTGGVFIQTAKPLPMGSPIDLTFTIPDSKETVTTKGSVIWAQQTVEGRKDLVPGMGVQFSASESQRRLLENFVQRYHSGRLTSANERSDKRAG